RDQDDHDQGGPEHGRSDGAAADASTLTAQLLGDLLVGVTGVDLLGLRQMHGPGQVLGPRGGGGPQRGDLLALLGRGGGAHQGPFGSVGRNSSLYCAEFSAGVQPPTPGQTCRPGPSSQVINVMAVRRISPMVSDLTRSCATGPRPTGGTRRHAAACGGRESGSEPAPARNGSRPDDPRGTSRRAAAAR